MSAAIASNEELAREQAEYASDRAVRAPRLTVEQREAVRQAAQQLDDYAWAAWSKTALEHTGQYAGSAAANSLRAAFPELGEVK